MTACPPVPDLHVQFIDVIAQTQQKDLQFYFCFPAKQKSLELIVIFQGPEYPFHLDRAVHPVEDPYLTFDIFVRFLPLFKKTFRYIQPLVPFGSCTFFFAGTTGTIFAFVYDHLRLIAIPAPLLLYELRPQLPSVVADISVTSLIVCHVLPFADVFLKLRFFHFS